MTTESRVSVPRSTGEDALTVAGHARMERTGPHAPFFPNNRLYTATSSFTSATFRGPQNIIHIDSSSSIFTLTLEGLARRKFFLVIKDVGGSAGSNNITIGTAASENIDGASTYVLNTNYECIWLDSDGTNYFIIGGYLE